MAQKSGLAKMSTCADQTPSVLRLLKLVPTSTLCQLSMFPIARAIFMTHFLQYWSSTSFFLLWNDHLLSICYMASDPLATLYKRALHFTALAGEYYCCFQMEKLKQRTSVTCPSWHHPQASYRGPSSAGLLGLVLFCAARLPILRLYHHLSLPGTHSCDAPVSVCCVGLFFAS